MVAGLALHRLGAVALEVPREWSAGTLAEVLERSGVEHAFLFGRDVGKWRDVSSGGDCERLAFSPRACIGELSANLRDTPWTHVRPDGWVRDDAGVSGLGSIESIESRTQPALVLYTSGSLGRPWGSWGQFANIDANTRSIVEYLELLGPDDRAMLTLPLHYCYGRSVLQTHLLVGGSVFLDHRM